MLCEEKCQPLQEREREQQQIDKDYFMRLTEKESERKREPLLRTGRAQLQRAIDSLLHKYTCSCYLLINVNLFQLCWQRFLFI